MRVWVQCTWTQQRQWRNHQDKYYFFHVSFLLIRSCNAPSKLFQPLPVFLWGHYVPPKYQYFSKGGKIVGYKTRWLEQWAVYHFISQKHNGLLMQSSVSATVRFIMEMEKCCTALQKQIDKKLVNSSLKNLFIRNFANCLNVMAGEQWIQGYLRPSISI